jgi:hypothetical protein
MKGFPILLLYVITMIIFVSCHKTRNPKSQNNSTPHQATPVPTPIVEKEEQINGEDLERLNNNIQLIYKETFANIDRFDYLTDGVRVLERSLVYTKKVDKNSFEKDLSDFVNEDKFVILLVTVFPEDFKGGVDSVPNPIDKSVLLKLY